ncbi:MAG: hypothetical protein U0871_02000 [Gemmataceae bacterium]
MASADPNAYSAWCLADGRTPPGSVPGLPGPWDGVWGDPAAVAAFTRIARDATPFVPVGLRLAQPLYPGRRADENADGGTVRHFVTAVLLTAPEAFGLTFGHPPTTAPAAVLRASAFDAAAAAIDRITRSTHREAVASVHRNAIRLNPWFTPAEWGVAVKAVAAAHDRDGERATGGETGAPQEPPDEVIRQAKRDRFDRLAPSRKKAWGEYCDARRISPELAEATDEQVYKWLDDQGEAELPQIKSWIRYVSECRSALGLQKTAPRGGRAGGGSSITRTP